MFEGLIKSKIFKSYSSAINGLINNPTITIPFIISSIIVPLITILVFFFIGGPEVFNFYFNPAYLIADFSVINMIFLCLTFSGLISSFIVSLLDSAGFSLCWGVVNKRVISKGVFRLALKNWVPMLITLLTLSLISVLMIYPILGIMTLGLNEIFYFIYAITAISFFVPLSFYSRIITVAEGVNGWFALRRSFSLFFKNFKESIAVVFLVLIVLLAFSWVSIIDSFLSFFINSFMVTPWINLFVSFAYKRIK